MGRAIDLGHFGFLLLDGDGAVVDASAAAGELLGRASDSLVGTQIAELIHHDDRGWAASQLELLVIGSIDRIHEEARFIGPDGSQLPVECTARRIDGEEDIRAVVLMQDVADRQARERELRKLADTDPLTELYNRRRFQAELVRHIAWTERYGARGALLVIDIDDLKAINDTAGHLTGDEAIVVTAKLLQERVRASDLTARLGGDEFAILLPAARGEDAAVLARALLEAIRAAPETSGTRSFTVSIGVAVVTERCTAERLFARADAAMYEVKRAGGDGSAVHSDQPPASAEPETREALDVADPTSQIELVTLLRAVAELGGASIALLSWELYATAEAVTPTWSTAIRAGLLKRARYDPVDREWQYELSEAGHERLQTIEAEEPTGSSHQERFRRRHTERG